MSGRQGPRDLPPLTEGQLEIMDVVWDRGECTVSDVVKLLSERRPVARNTVLTLMTRLAAKGWLVQHRRGRGFTYSAGADKGATQRGMARRLVDVAFGGSINGLVMALMADGELSQEELAAIRETIDRADGEGGE